MNRQSLIAVFAVAILLASASSALVIGASETYAAPGESSNQTPEFGFDGYTLISVGAADTYLMQKTARSEQLFGDAVPDGCGRFVTVKAAVTLNSDLRTIEMELEVLSRGDRILFFSDTLSEDGISEENAWIYDDIVPPFAANGIVSDVKNAWGLINELQKLLPKVSSKVVKEKAEAMLAKAVVKRIATAAASAVVPFVGWAVAIVSAGLAVYDVMRLMDELPGLVELARIDVSGCIFDEESRTLKLAERYGGNNTRESIALESMDQTDPSKRERGKYYIAYVYGGNAYVTNHSIMVQHAIAIMSIPNTRDIPDGEGLSVYTANKTDAHDIAKDAVHKEPVHHNEMHKHSCTGFYHYHVHGHDHERGIYPAHAFYGPWL